MRPIRPIFYAFIPLAAIASAAVWGGLLLGVITLRTSSVIDAEPMEAPVVEAPAVEEPRALTLVVAHRSSESCNYFSAFDTAPVTVTTDESRVDLQRDFEFAGCSWRSYETLRRIEGSSDFAYTYREQQLSCDHGDRSASFACTRDGIAR